MKRLSLLILTILTSTLLLSAANQPKHVEPPFWWAGMENEHLQLLVHANDIGFTTPKMGYEGITLKKTVKVDNPNYLFLNMDISDEAKAGSFNIRFEKDGDTKYEYTYQLRSREENSRKREGFNNSDIIYLLMPDRFANGNPDNDSHADMLEKADRSNPDGRHGGDLQGIMDHLDYFNRLGVTSIWLNPFLENNQEAYTYHGYATSNFYKVDPRLGSNKKFKQLVDKAHLKGLKVIQDMIFNHCGSGHWWMDDLPLESWIHQFPEYTSSNYRASTAVDPHASKHDLRKMKDGWFDKNMPDLNQKNDLLARYLIQNSIWWIEYAGIDGIRMDTQPYPDEDFMAQWAKEVMKEYPDFSIVGEAWIEYPAMVAYYQGGKENFDGYDSHLSHVFDFPGQYAVSSAFNEPNGWNTGVAKLYDNLAHDFLYPRPNDLVVFADNHDLSRLYSTYNENLDKVKMALTYVLTTRGVPSLLYGTEILMEGHEHAGHGKMRKDFPGGWNDDNRNAFTEEGRSEKENEIFNHIKTLAEYRTSSKVMQTGELTQFIPENGTYVYFRHNKKKTVMVVFNNTDEGKNLNTNRFKEIMDGYSVGLDVLNDEVITVDNIKLAPRSAKVVELR